MNTIVLIGRLARNPETKLASTQKGTNQSIQVSTGSKKKSHQQSICSDDHSLWK